MILCSETNNCVVYPAISKVPFTTEGYADGKPVGADDGTGDVGEPDGGKDWVGLSVGVIGEGVGGGAVIVCCNGLCVGDEDMATTVEGTSVLLIAMVNDLANQTVPIILLTSQVAFPPREYRARAASFAMACRRAEVNLE